MTERYIHYLEDENMLQIFGYTFTLEIFILRWFPTSQKNIRKVMELAWESDLDYDMFKVFGLIIRDLIKEQKLSERTGDKNVAKKLSKNIEYITFWLNSHRTSE